MSDIPSWFGRQEFYYVLYTVWFFLGVWLFKILTGIGLRFRHLLGVIVLPLWLYDKIRSKIRGD